MKVSKLFCAVLLAGSLAVIGCGSDDGGSSGNGGSNGNGNGNGASGACAGCDVQEQIPLCEDTYNACIQDDGGTPEDCAVFGLLRCQLL